MSSNSDDGTHDEHVAVTSTSGADCKSASTWKHHLIKQVTQTDTILGAITMVNYKYKHHKKLNYNTSNKFNYNYIT